MGPIRPSLMGPIGVECEMAGLMQDAGLAAEKSGRSGRDISVPILGADCKVEVKARASGSGQIYKPAAGRQLCLVVKRDRGLRDAVEVARLPRTRLPRLRWCRRIS
jgi:hypothetical protein